MEQIKPLPEVPKPQTVMNEFTIESVLEQQDTTPTYTHEDRSDRLMPQEPHINMHLPNIENHSHNPIVNPNLQQNLQNETPHHEQYSMNQPSSLLPDTLNPINLINSNTSNTYNTLPLPTPPTSSLLMPQHNHEDHHQLHHFNYENPTPNYIPSNSFNFIDFAKPTASAVPQTTPQLSMINQNFDFTKMLPPPLPTNNFITGGLDFSKNSLNGQPTYIDY